MGSDQGAQGFIESEHETPSDGYGPTPLGPGSSICLSSWGNGFSYLQPEPFMFQLVPLSLAFPPHTAVKSPAVSSPSLPSVVGMLLAAPEVIASPDGNSPNPTASPHSGRALAPQPQWTSLNSCHVIYMFIVLGVTQTVISHLMSPELRENNSCLDVLALPLFTQPRILCHFFAEITWLYEA